MSLCWRCSHAGERRAEAAVLTVLGPLGDHRMLGEHLATLTNDLDPVQHVRNLLQPTEGPPLIES